MNSKYIVTAIIAALAAIASHAQNEADFYTAPVNPGVKKNLVTDYLANGNDLIEDSQFMQNAIDAVSEEPNGGTIIIPAGTYFLMEINLKSNVHIAIDKDAIIKPTPRTDTRNYKLFNLGKVKNAKIENVSITGLGGYYTVDLREVTNINAGVFSVGAVTNFLISDCLVYDRKTKFSAINFGLTPFNYTYGSCKDGVVKNLKVYNADYGYGVIQTQAATHVLFKNLWGQGGVTLRLETGLDSMNELQIGGVRDIFARNIYCEHGNAALMISPHAMHNGDVNADTITSVGCGFAVRIGAGYVKKDQEGLGLTPGTYQNVSVSNIHATYNITSQLKSKHFKYMPCALRDSITVATDYTGSVTIHTGPSIAPVLNGSVGNKPGYFNATVTNVESLGFNYIPQNVLTEENAVSDAECDSDVGISENIQQESIKAFPNPFIQNVSIETNYNHNFNELNVLNAQGIVLYKQKISASKKRIQLSTESLNLMSGIYFLRLKGKSKSVTKVIFKQS